METIIALSLSALGFILSLAARPGCMVARLLDGIAHWLAKTF